MSSTSAGKSFQNLPRDAKQCLRAAMSCLKQRDAKGARQNLLKIEFGNTLAPFHRLMAAAAVLDDDFNLAQSHLEQAISIDPASQALRAECAIISRRVNEPERSEELLDSINLNSCMTVADFIRCGNAFLACDRFHMAAAAFEQGLAISPYDTLLRHRYAVSLTCTDAYDQAQSQWETCLKYNPKHVDALASLGSLLCYKNQLPDAIALFNKARRSDELEDKRVVMLNLIDAYCKQGSLDEAQSLLLELEDRAPEPRYYYLWATLMMKRGENKLAASNLHRCSELLTSVIGRENNPIRDIDSESAIASDLDRTVADSVRKLEALLNPLMTIKALRRKAIDELEISESSGDYR